MRPKSVAVEDSRGPAAAVWSWVAIGTLVIVSRIAGLRVSEPQNLPISLLAAPLLIWIGTSPAIVWWTNRLASRNLRVHPWIGHATGALLLSFLQVGLMHAFFDREALRPLAMGGPSALLYGTLIYAAIAAPTLLLVNQKKLEAEEIRRAEIERDYEKAHLSTVRAQVPERFLRGVFEALGRLTAIRGLAALALLKSFSAYLRALLAALAAERWTLRDEADLVLHCSAVLEDLPGRGRAGLEIDLPPAIEALPVRPAELHADVVRVLESASAEEEARLVLRRSGSDAVHVQLAFDDRVVLEQTMMCRAEAPEAGAGAALAARIATRVPPAASYAVIALIGIVLASAFAAVQFIERGALLDASLLAILVLHLFLPLAFCLLFAGVLLKLWPEAPRLAAFLGVIVAGATCGGYAYLAILKTFVSGIPDLGTFDGFRLVLNNLGPKLILCCAVLMLVMSVATSRRRAAAVVARADIERQLAVARLAVLRSQLHPHFLFNALNSVDALLRVDPAAAREMIGRMQDFYASAGELAERPVLELREEISLIRAYLAIEAVRFGKRLMTDVHVAHDAEQLAVPAFLLQPLVENAIKHGIARHGGSGFVIVAAEMRGERLHVTIDNSRGARAAETEGERPHHGMSNARRRLEAAYGRDFSLQFGDLDDRYRVSLSLPRLRVSAFERM